MAKYREVCERFHAEVSALGARYYVREGVVEVVKFGVSDEVFDDTLWKVQMCLYSLGGGHVWGTDGVGYVCNKNRHMVSVMKSPSSKSVLKCLKEMEANQ